MASIRYSAAFSAGGGLAMLEAAPPALLSDCEHIRTSC